MSPFAALLLLAHAALMLAAAPLVQGLVARVAGRVRGRVGPPLLLPWRDLVRLGRKTGLTASSASPLHRGALLTAASLTVTAALLVPSFAADMAGAPLADAATVGGLLVAARLALALAVLDGGEAAAGIGAGRLVLAASLVQPGLLLLLLGLALSTGTTNLDGMIAALHDQLPEAGAACLALLAVAALACGDAGEVEAAALADLSGAERGLAQFTAMLRRLIWLTLIAALLPVGPAAIPALDALALAGLGWAVKVAVLAAAFGVATGLSGGDASSGALTDGSARHLPALLGLGMLAALLACWLLVAAQRAA